MPFDTTARAYAFDAALLGQAGSLRGALGEFADTLPAKKEGNIKTLLCGLDHSEKGGFRALELGKTAVPIYLTDGRACLIGYWSLALKEQIDSGAITAEEIQIQDIKNLIPDTEI